MGHLNIIYTDRPITDDSFGSYDASQYTGTIEEAREELAYWVENGWATTEPTEENTIEVTAEHMQACIKEYLLHQ